MPDVHVSERTVLVWLAGDNNLYSEVPHKLSAIAEGFRNAASSDCRLIVYADRRGNYPQLIEIMPDGNQSVLETYPAQNSGSPETFSRFLNYMIETAPAKRYGLILFSHATGWLPQGALENPTLEEKPLSRTVFDDNGEQMTLAELAAATADFMPTYDHGFHIARHCGLTVYVPQTRFQALNAAYTETDWYRATHK